MRKIPAILLAVVSFFAWQKIVLSADLSLSSPTASSSSAILPNGMCSADHANDIEYLVFWPPLPGTINNLDNNLDNNLEASIKDFIAKLGTTGDGKTRQLGFGAGIPIFVSDESKIAQAIKQSFDIAKRTNVAVHFNVDDHIIWDDRPDLWNWYDPAKRGYNPDNKKNVEWYDWEGTPNKRRYLSPAGVPSQSPHMCYNSPAIQKEISRIVSQIVGPALREEINKLKQENKEYLFAGITVGAEAGFDDYSMVPKFSQMVPKFSQIPDNDPIHEQISMMLMLATKMMDEDKAPHSRVGYCSLTNAGYSKTNPPADINAALADVNQKFIEFWDKQFFDAGIPCSRIYTHVSASPPQDDNNNAPIRIVFNPYARPGWTTYLADFQPLYDELAKHGNPTWGGVEANAALSNAPVVKVSWETYLAWHYNHGAKLVGINIGASEQSLMSYLSKGAFGDEAMAAYKKFLNGKVLREQQRPVSAFSAKQLQEKIRSIQSEAPAWVQRTGRPDLIQALMMKLDASIKGNRLEDADKTADDILKLINAN